MATLESLTDLSGRVYNVLDHGVVGDGSTDDTAGFVTAIGAAAVGSILWIPPGAYKTDLVNFNKSLTVWADGAIVRPYSTPTTKLVKIGNDDGSRLNRFTLRGMRIELNAKDWATDIVGLQIINTCYVDTYDLEIALMKRGIEIKGITGEQCLYHNHRLRHINTCKNAIRITHDGTGSVNEINFYGGNFDYNANNYDMTGTVHVWCDPDGHTPNLTNIRFFAPCFQAPNSNTTAAQIDGGVGIYMEGARFENVDASLSPFNIISAPNTGMVEVHAIGAACHIDWNDHSANSLLRYKGNRITGQQLITPNDDTTQQGAGEGKAFKLSGISGQQSDLVQVYDSAGKGSRFDAAGNALLKHKRTATGVDRAATVNDEWILVSGSTTQTLPTAASMDGRDLIVTKTDAATTTTIKGNGSELINLANTMTLTTQGQSVRLRSDGTQWWVLDAPGTINITTGGNSGGGGAASSTIIAGATVAVQRGDTLTLNVTNLGALTGRTKLWFTIKASLSDADSRSLVQIEESAGLLYLNKAAAVNATDGAISVTDAGTGALTITLKPRASAVLPPGTNLKYDIQTLDGSGVVHTLTQGLATFSADVTRAIS